MTTGVHHFRPDIEGLRAIAILLVVAAHAGVPWLAGGFVGANERVCPSGICHAELNGIITYPDEQRIAASFARSLASPMASRLSADASGRMRTSHH